eukprot:TRINITY_DN1348_c0_g1_i3.p1 TRINITY_DN1348_c0_g1~~TRINITY_DN1348_c0_g1_i3.p1  ORF type:complete len:109 (+),score=15.75 TRINITY_DN1348_c0_g1_i3:25-351(+)
MYFCVHFLSVPFSLVLLFFFFFFFKQKTAYEMLRSLVGSEMCIRDRLYTNCTGRDDRVGPTRPVCSWPTFQGYKAVTEDFIRARSQSKAYIWVPVHTRSNSVYIIVSL